jgi:NADH-quinone oxidoreductase subunit N
MIPNLILYIIPIAILSVGGLVLMLADAFQHREGGLALPTAFLHFAAAAAGLALWNLAGNPALVADASRVLGGYLAFDRQALFLEIVIALGGGFASLLAGGYLAEHGLERGEFYTLLTFASAGCMMLAGASDLIMVFIGLETLSLGVYTMTGFRRTSGRSAEGALKYFLLGSFAAALLLYGSALLYGVTGHTDLAGIHQSLTSPLAVPAGADDAVRNFVATQQTVRDRIGVIGMLLVLVALAFKISAVPFHMWTPDAYEGAPTPATAYMSVAVKAAAFGALLRVMLTTFGDDTGAGSLAGGWPAILAWLAVLTMTVGNLIAMAQSSVKRMLAYSSIAHAGYLLLGVVIAPRTDILPGTNLTIGQSAVAAVLFYLLAYTVSNAGAFGALIQAGSKGREAVSYDDIAGLGKRHPGTALALSFFILSLTGVPPTAGFFAKFYVIKATLDAGYTWLAVIAMLNSVIAAYYYLRVLVKMYMQDPAPGAPQAVPMTSGFVSLSLIAVGVLVIYFGLEPGRYLQLAVDAVRQVAAS